jgi:hypothetical protein
MLGQALRAVLGTWFIVRENNAHRKRLVALLLFAPLVAGCSGASDMFSSDLLSKDAEWFSRSGRLFIRNVSIETPPLTPNRPITSDDLVSAEGYCPGMAPPANSNALAEGPAASPPPTTTGTVALGHTECDVVRGIGTPGSVNLSNNGRGDRVAVINYMQGQRAGIYTFTAGRLTSIERMPGAEVQPKPARSKKKPAAT